MKEEVFTLKNGLRLVFVDTQAFPTLTTLLLVGAGSRYENKDNNGVAHFFEHMAFKGSKKYPNSFIISSTIEGLGGIFNAFTAKDHTGYWIKSTAVHFETALDVIADMVKNPLLLPEEIEREKGVVIQEINMYKDTPQKKVVDLFESLLYQNNPLGYEIAGKEETVRLFNRPTLTEYIKNLYQPRNTVLVVAGGLNNAGGFPKRLTQKRASPLSYYLEVIEEKFSSWKNGQPANFVPVKERQSKPQILLKHKKTEQTHFCLGFRAFSFFDKRKYALSLLAMILGGGMSSRLFIEVRERRGLCYYISTNRELYHDCGNIVTQAGVANSLDKIKKAIEVILREHKKIAQGNLKEEELIKAKEHLKGRLLLSLEDSFNVATFFGVKKLLQNKIETPEQVVKKIEEVTVNDIVSVAYDIVKPEKLNLAIIGPFKASDFEESLKFQAWLSTVKSL